MKIIKLTIITIALAFSGRAFAADAGKDLTAAFARQAALQFQAFAQSQLSGSSSGDSQLSIPGSESDEEEIKMTWDPHAFSTPQVQTFLTADVSPEEIEQHKRTILSKSAEIRLRRLRGMPKIAQITVETKKQKRDARKKREEQFKRARVNRKRVARQNRKKNNPS